jgi:hypothetical protein
MAVLPKVIGIISMEQILSGFIIDLKIPPFVNQGKCCGDKKNQKKVESTGS